MSTTEQPAPVVEGAEPEAPLPATVPAVLGDAMAVSPAAMREELTRQVRRYVTEQRTARGALAVPEDAFPLTRTLAAGADALKHYGRVIRDLETEVRAHAEDEAAEIAGEAPEGTATTKAWRGDVVPAANVTIPDAEGDWHLKREWVTEVDVDWQSVISVQGRLTSAHIMANLAQGVPDPGDLVAAGVPHDDLEEFVFAIAQVAAEDTLDRLLFLSSPPKPKSTALKAWAAELSRKGLDGLASIVRSGWSSTRAYRGLSVDRS